MFTTKEAVLERFGYEPDTIELSIAQSMIEAHIGRLEADVTEAGDRDILGLAVGFQIVYAGTLGVSLLEQAAVKSMTIGDGNTVFDTAALAPFMSWWAVQTCKRLSWMGSRSVHTGPIFDGTPAYATWERV